MTPDMEHLVRASLEVRTIKETHELLQRTCLNAPSFHEISHYSADLNGNVRTQGMRVSQYDVAAVNKFACDALLKRQLETQQVPSWTALTAHWQRHGAPSCAGALGA